MDIVHHALIGGAGYIAASSAGHELAGAAFIAGSILPDLDVLFIAGGRRFYLRHHQGLTHSMVLAPLFAFGLFVALYYLTGAFLSVGPWVYAGALLGFWLHSALDLTNTFRIAALWPINRRRMSYDAVFFIDALMLALTAGFYFAYYSTGAPVASWAYFVLLAALVGIRLILRQRVAAVLKADYIIPSALNPLGYYVLELAGDGGRTFYYNALTGRRSQEAWYPAADGRYIALAQKSEIFRQMSEIMRALTITSVEAHGDGVRIVAEDLAVRNFGGRFGRTRLSFDGSGRLIQESANI